ncbi:MAG: hypothetical protein CBB97_11305 [Candidatus Endolissoclinum sp. TMED37]|nr:MAG: hypothetical protein CBB97_11305 [Candidatus Endolissoclinum sp. TMED37]
MAFQLSPGVLVQEQDATNVVPSVATTIGGIVGDFSWGPAREIVSIDSENNLVSRFGKPTDSYYEDFMTAASYLAYGSSLLTVREVGSAARNACVSGTAVLCRNDSEYEASYSAGEGSVGPWMAKFPGTMGNSIKVAIADLVTFQAGSVASITVDNAGSGYSSAPDVTIAASSITGGTATATATLSGSNVGSIDVTFAGIGYSSAPTVTISGGGGTGAAATATLTTDWAYKSNFDYLPSTTSYATNKSASRDEMHIIVIDEDGAFTGIAGTVLEKFPGVSKASDAKDDSNSSNYYKDVINARSQYIKWMDHPTAGTNWGTSAVGGTTYVLLDEVNTDISNQLTGGVDAGASDGDKQSGYDLFANDELVDINLVIASGHSATVGDYIIDNIADIRKDCLVFISPQKANVVNNSGSEVTDIITGIDSYTRSSYAVHDSGWKYMYDKYNDKYRWVPCNGDTAGTCVTADLEADPWFSPAGFSRGVIKNAVKLAFSPTKSQRDTLYSSGINPIIGSPGNGIVLFGDKTMLNKTSAFNRINVRRLFITVEKAIATAAKFQLFEFNDSFTRAQFRSLVEPFLRDVQGRRGIYDFRVVCDETNNTAQVIDANEFRADIFIKPAKSINFITLTFVATRTGISFEELGA